MAISTFPVKLYYPLKHTLKKLVVIQDLGDQNEQRISKNQSYGLRADGNGGQSAYKGQNIFGVNVHNMIHINGDITQNANKLWQFYRDVADGPLNAFYFYNPGENQGDPSHDALLVSGIDVVGRYLVRFNDNNLDFDLTVRYLYTTGLTLIEVRG